MDPLLTLAAIAAANLLGIIAPGPAFLMVSRASAGQSRTTGLMTGLGVASAATLWALAATFGVAVVMTRFALVYGLIQVAGGLYLIWLGLAAWRHGSRRQESATTAPAGSPGGAWLRGFTLSLTNPKIVIFFSSIFVALIPLDAPLWVRGAALAIVAAQETLWYLLVAAVFSHTRVQAAYRRVGRALDRLMGAVFVGLGARIITLARL